MPVPVEYVDLVALIGNALVGAVLPLTFPEQYLMYYVVLILCLRFLFFSCNK